MTTHHQAAQVRELLARKLSQRAIQRATGIPRRRVAAIARGAEQIQAAADAPRCPKCGALVALPCLACATRQTPKAPAVILGPAEPLPLGFELRPDHEARRLEIVLGIFAADRQAAAPDPSGHF